MRHHRCPSCQRTFDEPGYCPFDGSALASSDAPPPAAPHQPTIPNEAIASAAARTAAGQLHAVSAAGDATAALAGLSPRGNLYDQLIGQTLDGRYYIDRKLGEGGMGVVFAARHAVIERPLAIKVLKREVTRDLSTIQRFVQEAQAASRIGHPNIVEVTDFGTTPDGMTYSVMEMVAGQTLGTLLRAAAPLPPARAVRIAAQLARALGAAHDKGIVHRDLKPENVFLVDRDGRPDFVKVVDFGIAKVTPVDPAAAGGPRLTRAGAVFGTPEYMAPEQAAGRGDIDGRIDIYALGILLYEMVTGRVPHRGESAVRTLAMQMLDPIEPPSRRVGGLPAAVEAVIMKALAKQRDARYQTMGELLAALEALDDAAFDGPAAEDAVAARGTIALAPLPPGADPALVAAPPPPSTSAPTMRRLRDEPEFVTGDKPPTFEHVFTDPAIRPRAARWPIWLLLALITAGAAAVIAVVVSSRARVAPEPPREAIARPAPADAVAPDPPVADATVVVVPVPADALDIVLVEPDAGHRIVRRPRLDAGRTIPRTPNGRGTIGIQVLTRPEGATLYAGHDYRGPGGVTLEEPLGQRLEIECRLRGYKPGRVSLVFDGRTEIALCVLERIKVCIDGIKNPFDDCTPAP